MANNSLPCGFRPYGDILRVRPYIAKATIARGDAVNRKAGSSDTNGSIELDLANASEALIGVAANSAVSGGVVLVYDHPDQEFVAQADDGSIATNAKIGLNYDLLEASAVSGVSRQQIDASTFATSATLPLKVLRLLPSADNAIGTYCKCILKINNHQLAGGTGVAGV